MNATWCLILLPLNSNRRLLESFIHNYRELVNLYNANQYLSWSVTRNFQKLVTDTIIKAKQNKFLTQYLKEFQFFDCLTDEAIEECLEDKTLQIVTVEKGKLLDI